MRFGSLFAGIGGFDLGLEWAGMECAWQVEIDAYAQRVLAKHWPDVKRYEDVRECGKHNLESVDLICGGFPCQPFSVAGDRRASEDERDLWPEFARIIGELRPRWVLAENVPGILSAENGRYFGGILRDLAAIGYDAEWDCLPAAAFGAPHFRYRVFLVGHLSDPHSSGHRRIFQSERQPRSSQAANAGGNGKARSVAGWLQKEWAAEPNVERVANGIPARVDRIRGLGNACVPQVVEWIGCRIITSDNSPSLKK